MDGATEKESSPTAKIVWAGNKKPTKTPTYAGLWNIHWGNLWVTRRCLTRFLNRGERRFNFELDFIFGGDAIDPIEVQLKERVKGNNGLLVYLESDSIGPDYTTMWLITNCLTPNHSHFWSPSRPQALITSELITETGLITHVGGPRQPYVIFKCFRIYFKVPISTKLTNAILRKQCSKNNWPYHPENGPKLASSRFSALFGIFC